jgi:hypothetical protein
MVYVDVRLVLVKKILVFYCKLEQAHLIEKVCQYFLQFSVTGCLIWCYSMVGFVLSCLWSKVSLILMIDQTYFIKKECQYFIVYRVTGCFVWCYGWVSLVSYVTLVLIMKCLV